VNLKWDTVPTAVLVICALITTGLVVHREFFAPPASGESATHVPVLVQDWKSLVGQGVLLGPPSAPVQLIEFADFECPYCGGFHKTLKTLRERYPAQVALTYVHFPIQGHRFALPAARAAECAGEQGRFEAMHDRLFQEQDQLGLKSWSEFATEAGVPDSDAFNACIKRSGSMPRVVEGQQLGKELDVQGTPTVIVNGWRFGNPPTEKELDEMVKAVLAGKEPVSGARKS
jgi:NhaA family Na+:H+ antiporter